MSKGSLVRRVRQICGKDTALRLALRFSSLDGGPGSGNFGHKGRPGKVGGSGGGGGSAYRTTNTSSPSGYIGIQRAKSWKGIATAARTHKGDYDGFVDSLDETQRNAIIAQHKQCGTKEGFQSYAERVFGMLSETKAPPRPQNVPVDGKDITSTYAWKGEGMPTTSSKRAGTEAIDTAIEDVLHQQGYDGVPKVVPKSEFDRITAENPGMPILFRSYAAPSEEVLQDYDDMLESGFFYVDCGAGGSQYGQGMYCAGCYGDDKKAAIKGAMSEMQEYRQLGRERCIREWEPIISEGEGYEKVTGTEALVWKNDKMVKLTERMPEDGQQICIRFTGPDGKVWAERTGTWDEKQQKLVFPLGLASTGIDPDLMKNSTWAPIERKVTSWDVEPVASTRMMTLDPSAKIITYEDAQTLMSGGLAKEQRKEIYQERLKDYQSELDEQGVTGPERFVREYAFKIGLDLVTQEDQIRYGKVAEQISDEDRKRFLDEGEKKGQEAYSRTRDEIERGRKERAARFERLGRDVGVCMAALGYDAINAEGHGSSGSYTVVLNRTKLIISEERVDVE